MVAQGKYDQAAEMYRDDSAIDRAVAMFNELCMFDKAAFWSSMQTSDTGVAAGSIDSTENATATAEEHIKVHYLKAYISHCAHVIQL